MSSRTIGDLAAVSSISRRMRGAAARTCGSAASGVADGGVPADASSSATTNGQADNTSDPVL